MVTNPATLIRRKLATVIAGADRTAVADVLDAHLETLSMILLTSCWAVGYGWFEAVIGIGGLLGVPGSQGGKVQWFQFLGTWYSSYHLFFGFTIFVLTFGIGFLKFNRMLYARKRYLLFTSLAAYPLALTLQDFSYFFFSPIFNGTNSSLDTHAWTCGGLGLGCITLANPWKPTIPFIIPEWYFVTLTIALVLYFLAFRSALVNLLVTREVMKESGLIDKTVLGPIRTSQTKQEPREAATPLEVTPPLKPTEAKPEVKPEVAKIVDQDREALIRKLRERIERTGRT
jgi:hypothetical protein